MLENAVAIDPKFALANAAIANVCAQYHYHYDRASSWLDRALATAKRASELRHERPNEATVLYNLACVFRQLERTKEAMQILEKAWEVIRISIVCTRRPTDENEAMIGRITLPLPGDDQSRMSRRAVLLPRIPARASAEMSRAAMLSSIFRRLPIWCG